MKLHYLPIHELHPRRLAGEITTEAIVQSVVDQIEKTEPKVKAYLYLQTEKCLEQAQKIDRMIKNGIEVPPLAGMPLSVKDVFVTRHIPTSCGSKILRGFIPPFESTVTEKLLQANYGLMGKTNLDEFAMGSSTENSGYQITHNPWDLERVPGGSSGGSAAAVAAGMCLASIGTDTGGSIRQPASFTGLVGFKPTYGRVSRYGMTAFASSLEQGGPLARDTEDAALILETISGHDKRDATSLKLSVPRFRDGLNQDISGKKIGRIADLDLSSCSPDVRENFENTLQNLEKSGAEIIDVKLPNIKHAIAAYYILAPAEASSNLGRYDGIRYGHRASANKLLDIYKQSRDEGFGDEVKLRILVGTFVLSSGYYDTYYGKAQIVQALIRKQFQNSFAKVDAIATPVSPETAFKIGENVNDPLKMYLLDSFTIPANLAGIPGISVPSGFDRNNLPIGFQLLGNHGDETTLVSFANWIENNRGFKNPVPSF